MGNGARGKIQVRNLIEDWAWTWNWRATMLLNKSYSVSSVQVLFVYHSLTITILSVDLTDTSHNPTHILSETLHQLHRDHTFWAWWHSFTRSHYLAEAADTCTHWWRSIRSHLDVGVTTDTGRAGVWTRNLITEQPARSRKQQRQKTCDTLGRYVGVDCVVLNYSWSWFDCNWHWFHLGASIRCWDVTTTHCSGHEPQTIKFQNSNDRNLDGNIKQSIEQIICQSDRRKKNKKSQKMLLNCCVLQPKRQVPSLKAWRFISVGLFH